MNVNQRGILHRVIKDSDHDFAISYILSLQNFTQGCPCGYSLSK